MKFNIKKVFTWFLDSFFPKKVVTRIAPSPTGPLHMGTARSALFNYLYAKQHGGTFIVRIEDTDTQRSTKVFENSILDGLSELGLQYDALYRQSERGKIYKEYIQKMLTEKTAFVSKEESKQEQGKMVEVIRLKNPNKIVSFTDIIRGEISFDTTELGDFVIARSMDDPLYHLAVVVDDHALNVTHAIRGEDHISNTPRQILIQEALGIKRPRYGHLPLILMPDKSKMSKRKHATSVKDFLDKGYLPAAIINFLAFLGWNPGGEKEIFTLTELVKEFSLEKSQKGGAIFNEEKLKWFNKEHLKLLSDEEFLKNIHQHTPTVVQHLPLYSIGRMEKLLPILRERIVFWGDLEEIASNGELDFFFDNPTYTAKELIWRKGTATETKENLQSVYKIFSEMKREWNSENIKNSVWEYAEERGRGSVLWPLRFALTGREKSPDPFFIASVLGQKETLSRINQAVSLL